MRTSFLILVVLVLAGGCAGAPAVDGRLAAAVADPRRPAADRARDAARQPAVVLAFAGVRPGQRVGEYMPGAGYFTPMFSAAVGAGGRVYAYQPSEIVRLVPKYLTDIRAAAAAAPHPNVTVISAPTADFAAPEPLDLVFTAQNYHDLHTRFAPPGAAQAFNAAVFRALKPGGAYLVIDHRAPAGAGRGAADSLHRIDPAQVMTEVLAAGFVFEAESRALANPGDPGTESVFAPAIRGTTDQFAYRFRRP